MLMTSEAGNEDALALNIETEAEEDHSDLKQIYKECAVLLKDPEYVLTAPVNSYSFSIMVYLMVSQ